jgi:hypothetical protein
MRYLLYVRVIKGNHFTALNSACVKELLRAKVRSLQLRRSLETSSSSAVEELPNIIIIISRSTAVVTLWPLF